VPDKSRAQGLVNIVVRTLLRTPGVGRVAGRYLLTLPVTGRKTGKRYHVPVAYIDHEGDILIGTAFPWARNLRTGDTVTVRHRGSPTTADVHVHTSEDEVTGLYGVIARTNHNFAGFNRITLDAQGNPDEADLHKCWREGARVLRLIPRRTG
jgi:deazaflavin-dependent oxidoreductase (nitroreductase family)